ncbi:MAG: hypothetical protein GY895_05655, partial [Phycisphaera sp.]|nr:hypothetical protein [Phycisphaera sp.]
MSFVAAGILVAGIACAAIPVLIHLLLRRRTRPVEWAAMSILIEAARRHRSRSRIERILLLTIRTLLVMLLGAALAQPLIGERLGSLEPSTTHLVIDDGIMSAVRTVEGGIALDDHIADALKTIDGLSVSDRVSVTLAGRPVRTLVSPPTTDHRSVARVIEELRPREGATDIPAAVEYALEANPARGPRSMNVFSGFRRGVLDERLRPSTAIIDTDGLDLRLSTPGERDRSSITIDDLTAVRAPLSLASLGDLVFVKASLSRGGDLDSGSTVVRISGNAISTDSIQEVQWSEGEQRTNVEFRIRVDDDGGVIQVNIDGDDDLDLDDQRTVAVEGRAPRRILLVGRGGLDGLDVVDRLTGVDWFERALVPDTSGALLDIFDLDRIDPISIDDRDLEDASIIVLGRPDLLDPSMEERLAEWVEAGGILVVLPPEDEIARPWAGSLLSTLGLDWSVGLEPVRLDEPRQLDRRQPESSMTEVLGPELADLAAGVRIDRRLAVGGFESGDVVLVDELEEPVVVDVAIGGGRFILFTVAPVLSWTDLPVRPLMVPLVQELVRQSSALADRSAATVVGEGPPRSSLAFVESARMPSGRMVPRQGFESTTAESSGSIEFLDVSGRTVDVQVVNPASFAVDLRASNRSEIIEWMSGSGTWRFSDSISKDDEYGRFGSNLATILVAIVLVLAILDLVISRWTVRGGLVTSRRKGLTGANA